jgi:hypothetical protein
VRTGKKIGIVLLAVLLTAALLTAGGIVYLNRYLGSSGFLELVRKEAREKAGIDLKLETLDVDVFRGVTAKNVTIAGPVAGKPPAAEAGEIEFSYRLGDILQKKLTIDEVRILRPRLRLGGAYSLSVPMPEGKGRKGGKRQKRGGGEADGSGWTASVSALTVSDGAVELSTGTALDPVEAEGIDGSLRFPSPGQAAARLTVASARWQNREVVKKGRAEASFVDLDPDSLSGQAEVTASALIVDPFAPEKKAEPADLAFRASAREGEARIENFRAHLPGMDISGHLTATVREKEIRAEGKAVLDSSDIGEILRRFLLIEKPPVRGKARGDFIVSGPAVAGLIVLPDFRGNIVSAALAFPSLGVARDVKIPIRAEKGKLSAEKAQASLAGGTLTLDAETDLGRFGPSPFRASFRAEGVDCGRLFRESPYSRDPSWKRFRCAGSFGMQGSLSGDSTGLQALTGQAHAVITGGSVSGYPLPSSLNRISGDWLEPFDFERAEAKISCREGVATLEEVTVMSAGMKIAARGTIDLNRQGELDLRVALLYPPELAEEQPKAFRLALRAMPGEKGLLGIEFRVYGRPERPETDLLEVMARRTIGGFLGGQ